MKGIKVNVNSKYDYFGMQQDDSNNYLLSKDKFQQMIANRQYEDAADYASNFHFKDPEENKNWQNYITNLKREGRIYSCIYSKIPEDKRPMIEFYDNVFIDGGLDGLQKNEIADKFEKFKNGIGNSEDQIADKLAITFEPHKSTFLGIDWLSPDNNNDIEHFYENSGFTEQQLKANDIKVTHKDGKTTLTFKKSHPLSNKILYNLKTNAGYGNEPITIEGIKSNFQGDDTISKEYYTLNTQAMANSTDVHPTNSTAGLWLLQSLIKKSKEEKDKYFVDIDSQSRDYSTTIVGPLFLDMEELQQKLSNGLISNADYNTQMTIRDNYIQSVMSAISSGNYEMFSNYKNIESGDETLDPMDNKLRNDIINIISANPKAISLSAMIGNGKIGTCVSIGAGITAINEDNYDTDNMSNNIKRRRIQVFIPGLFQEEVQKKINNNTRYKAIQEINDMETFGYEYKTESGNVYISDGAGGFINSNTHKAIDKNEVIKEINKDYIKQEARNLKYNFITYDDKLPNIDGYIKMARLLAIKAGNELNPEVPLTDTNGRPYSVQEVFNMLSTVGNATWNPHDMNWSVYNKLNDIFDLYSCFMQDIEYYK